MTVADATDLFSYWRRYPPANEVLFAVHGGKDSGPREKSTPHRPGEAEPGRWPTC